LTTCGTKELISALEGAGFLRGVRGDLPDVIEGVCDDSRRAAPGDVFVAVPGAAADGHEFVEAARASGASVAVVEREDHWGVPRMIVSDARRAGVLIADLVYGRPAGGLRIAGVTGTNGKTTTVHIARAVLDSIVAPAASLGTLGVLEGAEGRVSPGGAGLTTPGAIELRRVLRQLSDSGIQCVAMEVSSHSLVQGRVDGLAFEVAAFTTFTRDHLDYHGTMEEYFRAKSTFVDYVAPAGTLVINADDAGWSRLPRPRRVLTYGIGPDSDVRAENVRFGQRESMWTLRIGYESADVRLPLVGEFNVGNALAGAAIAHVMGASVDSIAGALFTVPQVPGRLEVLAESPLVVRDYAHTPDALERSLLAVRRLAHGRVIVVFGCGGDRDRGKRPLMGAVAARLADQAVVTSDNPRGEDPERIMDDIVADMPAGSYVREEDRRRAIGGALASAQPDDVVLIAGKGHETYQIRGATVLPFDEKEIVGELLAVPS
jgi:UDP-N-acetylmuramoyl-L-alanyl-D-glutamate--2,6-diaminopimelate ligase